MQGQNPRLDRLCLLLAQAELLCDEIIDPPYFARQTPDEEKMEENVITCRQIVRMVWQLMERFTIDVEPEAQRLHDEWTQKYGPQEDDEDDTAEPEPAPAVDNPFYTGRATS